MSDRVKSPFLATNDGEKSWFCNKKVLMIVSIADAVAIYASGLIGPDSGVVLSETEIDVLRATFVLLTRELNRKDTLSYLVAIGWIEAQREISELPITHIMRILGNFGAFAEKVAAFGATQAGGTDNE